MTSVYIKFENLTGGEKAKAFLKTKGIDSQLKRNPNPNHRQGCGFALYVKGDPWRAFDLLSAEGMPNLGIGSGSESL